MKRTRYTLLFRTALALGLLLTLIIQQTVIAQTPDTIGLRIVPQTIQVSNNDSVELTLEVDEVTNLYAVDIELTYDPAIIEIIDADSTTEGVQVSPGTVFAGQQFFTAENYVSEGVIRFAGTLIAPERPFAGQGSLLRIEGQTVGFGQTALNFSRAILVDNTNQAISLDTQSGEIRVGGSVTLIGQARRQGVTDHSNITIETASEAAQTGADGRFSVAGFNPYTLNLTSPGYLSLVVQGTAPAELTTVDVGRLTLLAGDVTEDDRIDIFDLALLGSQYESNDPQTDLNDDGRVDIFDLALAAANYGQEGSVSSR